MSLLAWTKRKSINHVQAAELLSQAFSCGYKPGSCYPCFRHLCIGVFWKTSDGFMDHMEDIFMLCQPYADREKTSSKAEEEL